MNVKILKILGFLIGLFIAISVLSYYILNRNIEKFTEVPTTSSYKYDVCTLTPSVVLSGADNTVKTTIIYNINSVENTVSLPSNDNKYMLISTYYNNLRINESKWYDDNIDITSLDNTFINNGLYFLIKGFPTAGTGTSSTITLSNNVNNFGAKIANINNIELSGPNAMYFANNSTNNNYNLTSLTVIFIIKITDFKETNNILFEMIGNTIPKKNGNNYNYLPSRININFIKNTVNPQTFNIELTIGNNIYTSESLNNIPMNNIKNPDYNIITLMVDEKNIDFIINTDRTKFVNKNTDSNNNIILSSMPITINKDGNINCSLYNFIYYKKRISDTEFLNIKLFVDQYIYGIYYREKELNILQSKVLQCNSSNITNPSKYFESKLVNKNTIDSKLPIIYNDVKYEDKCKNNSCSINNINTLNLYDDYTDKPNEDNNNQENEIYDKDYNYNDFKEDIKDEINNSLDSSINNTFFSKIINYIGLGRS